MQVVADDERSGHGVRVVERDGEPWWILADVCRVLEIGNPSDAARRLDDDEKDTVANDDGIAEPQVWALSLQFARPLLPRHDKLAAID